MDRRSFVLAGFCLAAPPIASALGGCSFSLRDFLHSDTRIWGRGSNEGGEAAGKESMAKTAETPEENPAAPEAVSDTQYGFWMDSASCVECASCVEACRQKSGAPKDAPARRAVRSYVLEDGLARSASVSCMHCAEPACADVCPAEAISKRIDGIVVVDREKCIGCRYCRQACPFGAPHYVAEGMDKCDCCLGAGVRAGADPHCVRACPTKALQYGALEQLRRRKGCPAETLRAPTGPSYFLS